MQNKSVVVGLLADTVVSTYLELAYLELRSISNQIPSPLDLTGIFSVIYYCLSQTRLCRISAFLNYISFPLVQKYPLYLEQLSKLAR